MTEIVDLGNGGRATPVEFEGEIVGFIVHCAPACVGGFVATAPHYPSPRWDLISVEPPTLQPSILCGCGCGSHGWITSGKWVPA
jgi:hypothetical protein